MLKSAKCRDFSPPPLELYPSEPLISVWISKWISKIREAVELIYNKSVAQCRQDGRINQKFTDIRIPYNKSNEKGNFAYTYIHSLGRQQNNQPCQLMAPWPPSAIEIQKIFIELNKAICWTPNTQHWMA